MTTAETGSDRRAAPPDFVLDLLRELRASGYRPAAWARFFARSWRSSQDTAREHPRLVASWRRVTVGLALGEAAALGGEALLGGHDGRVSALRALPGTALCLTYTLGDAYVHLGMNQPRRGEPLFETLGGATALTLARGAATGLLIGHLLGGRPAPRALAASALAIAIASDIGDGRLARTTHHTTRLGAYLDGEVDFGFGVTLALTFMARGWLPRWLATLLLARWVGPLAYTLACYFGTIDRVVINSTAIGRAAGIAQTATVAISLLPDRISARIPRLRRALHLATGALLLAAPLTQLARARVRTPSRLQRRSAGP